MLCLCYFVCCYLYIYDLRPYLFFMSIVYVIVFLYMSCYCYVFVVFII